MEKIQNYVVWDTDSFIVLIKKKIMFRQTLQKMSKQDLILQTMKPKKTISTRKNKKVIKSKKN